MSAARDINEHWCWCCSSKVECTEDRDTKELVCNQCGNTFVEIYDPSNEDHRPESFIPPTISSPAAAAASSSSAAAAASSSSAAAAAATIPNPASTSSHAVPSAATTNHAMPQFAFLSPSLSNPVQIRSLPRTRTPVAAPMRPAGGNASAGAAAAQMPRSVIAGSLQSVLQHLIRSIHGRMGMNPMGGFNAGMAAGSNNIHGDIGNYAFGNLQNIMNELMERNPGTHGPNPTPADVIAALPRIKVEKKEDHTEGCSICQDDFNVGDTLVSLPCKHKFKEDCIMPWLVENNSCPICRKSLKRSAGAAAASNSSGSASGSAAARST